MSEHESVECILDADLFGEPAAHDPGGKVRLKIAAGMSSGAYFSPCGQYRLWLSRRWADGPYALWIGMNPSTATEHVDDPTIRREIGFTERMGLGAYFKANVMDYRATNPRNLIRISRPCSTRNLEVILDLATNAEKVILAWGSIDPRLRNYPLAVEMMLGKTCCELWCLGINKDGAPKHPLYVRGDTPLIRYKLPGDTSRNSHHSEIVERSHAPPKRPGAAKYI